MDHRHVDERNLFRGRKLRKGENKGGSNLVLLFYFLFLAFFGLLDRQPPPLLSLAARLALGLLELSPSPGN
ncbi:hypothetical protein OPV22_010937 [Ensete ventricosum]|uniref:Transmembrane protein n=1 Tax=Ensete ventricosum TaxID=4639 RepID=A0AAV8REJ2_ENSVE|nr:hypothetical protein OPV22_010937 [Ensete ventricosum]